jgi:hypothetical protein
MMPRPTRGTCTRHPHPQHWSADPVSPVARSLCSVCPVRVPCRRIAVDHPAEPGTWAGMSPAERARIHTYRHQEEPDMATTPAHDMLVISPDGTARWDTRRSGETIRAAVRRHITDPGTQGVGGDGAREWRLWFTDDFSGMAESEAANRVCDALGYIHPYGWRGVVIVTAEEDGTGDVPPLTPDDAATLTLALVTSGVSVSETGRTA